MPNGVPMTWMSILHEHPPIVVESQSGGTFADIDGNTYADFNLADMSIPVATVSPQPAVGLSSAAAIVLLKNVMSAYTQRWLLILGAVYIVTTLAAPQGLWSLRRTARPRA